VILQFAEYKFLSYFKQKSKHHDNHNRIHNNTMNGSARKSISLFAGLANHTIINKNFPVSAPSSFGEGWGGEKANVLN
jgi:hypothetical protein